MMPVFQCSASAAVLDVLLIYIYGNLVFHHTKLKLKGYQISFALSKAPKQKKDFIVNIETHFLDMFRWLSLISRALYMSRHHNN